MTDDMKRISRFKHQAATAVLIAFLALGGLSARLRFISH